MGKNKTKLNKIGQFIKKILNIIKNFYILKKEERIEIKNFNRECHAITLEDISKLLYRMSIKFAEKAKRLGRRDKGKTKVLDEEFDEILKGLAKQIKEVLKESKEPNSETEKILVKKIANILKGLKLYQTVKTKLIDERVAETIAYIEKKKLRENVGEEDNG